MSFELVEKAGINGIVSAAASAAIFGTQAKVVAPFTQMTMPLYALIFLGVLLLVLLPMGYTYL